MSSHGFYPSCCKWKNYKYHLKHAYGLTEDRSIKRKGVVLSFENIIWVEHLKFSLHFIEHSSVWSTMTVVDGYAFPISFTHMDIRRWWRFMETFPRLINNRIHNVDFICFVDGWCWCLRRGLRIEGVKFFEERQDNHGDDEVVDEGSNTCLIPHVWRDNDYKYH